MYGYEGKDNNKHGERTEAKGKKKGILYKKRKVRTYLVGTVNVGCEKEALSVSHRTIVSFLLVWRDARRKGRGRKRGGRGRRGRNNNTGGKKPKE